jgi:hypothetical protein
MKNNRYINSILFLIIMLCINMLYSGCGEGTVDLSDAKYEPKIVMEAYIYPNHKVDKIKITRNIPFDKPIDFSSVILNNAKVVITDLNENKSYELSYNTVSFSFEDKENILQVGYGKNYKMEVWANIDGRDLYASSITTVPLKGLKIIKYDNTSIQYREKDEFGNLKKYKINLEPSPDANIHAISIVAENPGVGNFIYDNPYFKPDTSEINKNIDQYSYAYYWLEGFKSGTSQVNFEIEWLSIWFYTEYRVIIYAGDKNFKDFFLTQKDVQEMDGNFHEPKLHIEGDGIGVFASAVVDTTYFQVTR